jgi:hypothetical protein
VVNFGYKIAEVPVTTRYFNEASSITFRASVTYGLKTLYIAFRYLFHRLKLWPYRIFKEPLPGAGSSAHS